MSNPQPPAKPSVLIIIDTRIIGGPGRGLFHFLDCVDKTNFEYLLCTFHYTKPGSQEFIEEATRRGYNLKLIRQGWSFDPRPLWHIWRLLRGGHFNILQTHGYKGHLVARLLTMITKIPWIAFSHGWTSENKKVGLYNSIGRWSMLAATMTVAVSEPLAEEMRRMMPGAAAPIMVPNAINLDTLQPLVGGPEIRESLAIPRDGLVLGCFGRLSTEKGQRLLLEALHRLGDTAPHVIFVGSGPDEAALRAQANDLGVAAKTHFVGYQSEMVRYYDAVDIVVIPSLSEGLPNVLLEALAYKKIVVSTPVGAVPTILANGETGYLAQSADVEALTAALQRCLEDTGSHSTLREQGYELIEKRFSAKTRAARVVELYRTILSRVYS